MPSDRVGPATESALLDAPAGPDVITKKQYAAEWLREMIVSGDLAPGRRVRQQEVADRLRISATPVREAILQLETEGYLQSVAHVGVKVAELAEDHHGEVMELRTLLEGQLASTAAQRITDAQIENHQLHGFIWEIAGRDVTRQIVQGLWARVPWHSLDDVAGRGRQSVVEHAELVEALRNRDAEGARRATELHIASSHAYLVKGRQ
jgi:DNA-binding GntR family transcriptional regulator